MDDAQKLAEALGTYETIIKWVFVLGMVLLAFVTVLDWCRARIERQQAPRRVRRRKRSPRIKRHEPNTRILSSADEKVDQDQWYYLPLSPVVIDVEYWKADNAHLLLEAPSEESLSDSGGSEES